MRNPHVSLGSVATHKFVSKDTLAPANASSILRGTTRLLAARYYLSSPTYMSWSAEARSQLMHQFPANFNVSCKLPFSRPRSTEIITITIKKKSYGTKGKGGKRSIVKKRRQPEMDRRERNPRTVTDEGAGLPSCCVPLFCCWLSFSSARKFKRKKEKTKRNQSWRDKHGGVLVMTE